MYFASSEQVSINNSFILSLDHRLLVCVLRPHTSVYLPPSGDPWLTMSDIQMDMGIEF